MKTSTTTLAALAISTLGLAACTAKVSTSTSTGGGTSVKVSTDLGETDEDASLASATADDEGKDDATPYLGEIRKFIKSKNIDKSVAGWKTRLPKPPKLEFEKGAKIFWNLETSEGDVTIQLMPDVAPMHVSSTMYLVDLGYYDDLTFHRVITGFMAQGGCPLGTGTGSPGYKYAGEFDPKVRHTRPGLLSMANAGPNTDGSQFFLTFVPTSWLDGKHTIFGEVISGMDVVKKLESYGSQSGRTSKKLKMKKSSITIGKPAEKKTE